MASSTLVTQSTCALNPTTAVSCSSFLTVSVFTLRDLRRVQGRASPFFMVGRWVRVSYTMLQNVLRKICVFRGFVGDKQKKERPLIGRNCATYSWAISCTSPLHHAFLCLIPHQSSQNGPYSWVRTHVHICLRMHPMLPNTAGTHGQTQAIRTIPLLTTLVPSKRR